MFERYNINDLFLASIDVIYPERDTWDVNIGGIFMLQETGYGYLTILKKNGNTFIDLNDTTREITTTRDPNKTSYIIEYMEPLSKYYTQEGKKKEIFSKRKALLEAQKYYNIVHQEHLAKIDEKSKTLK